MPSASHERDSYSDRFDTVAFLCCQTAGLYGPIRRLRTAASASQLFHRERRHLELAVKYFLIHHDTVSCFEESPTGTRDTT
jgi:hypothetical protein